MQPYHIYILLTLWGKAMLVKTHGEIWAQLSLLKLIILSEARFYHALRNWIIVFKYSIWVVDRSLSIGIELLVWSDHIVTKAQLMPLIDRMCAKLRPKICIPISYMKRLVVPDCCLVACPFQRRRQLHSHSLEMIVAAVTTR